jgi:hypothetical protein
MKKIITVAKNRNEIFKQQQLTMVWMWEIKSATTASWMRQVT